MAHLEFTEVGLIVSISFEFEHHSAHRGWRGTPRVTLHNISIDKIIIKSSKRTFKNIIFKGWQNDKKGKKVNSYYFYFIYFLQKSILLYI